MELARLPGASPKPDQLSNEEMFWHWRRSLIPPFDCVTLTDPVDPPEPLRSTQYHVGELLIVDAEYPHQRFVRDHAAARPQDNADHVLLQVFLRGMAGGIEDDEIFSEEPGGVYAINLGYGSDAADSAATMSLVLPRDWLTGYLPALRDAPGAVIAKNSMAARLFGDFMLSLRRNLPYATVDDAPVISRSLIGFLRSLLSQEDPVGAAAQTGAFQALQRHIDGNLGDVELGADTLCARFRMSRATLFRLFKDHGGVRNYIRRRRLMACFEAMWSPQQADRRIYDIGLDFGFINPSHLSTLFRQHFGMSPRQVRQAARCHESGGGAIAAVESTGTAGIAGL